ncbi:hypothetical protein FSB65_26580 [Paraburkholderia sp. JPY418]|nr:hypothetical protein [Paraburkholderia youngii]
MPELSLHHNISKSLRCYKRETLCKPLFSKTVLQCPGGSARHDVPSGELSRIKRCRQELQNCHGPVECKL